MTHRDDLFLLYAKSELQCTNLRRLVRWLSLPYGENTPIFHGPDREALEATYRDAVTEDDGDPAYWAAAQQFLQRPPPGPPEDWGDIEVETISIDGNGNTITDTEALARVREVDRLGR